MRTGHIPDVAEWQEEQISPSSSITGQILEINQEADQVLIYLNGIMTEEEDAWVALPQELTGWALD